jgi:nucleotide-binding universal stress UspA family protein
MFNNVLIGIDGREGGRDAVALARELAAPEATFTLAHVYDTLRGGGAGEPVLAPRAVSQQLLEREREQASLDAELVARAERKVGHGLHEIAEDTRANLLVVGPTRHALLGRVLLGDYREGRSRSWLKIKNRWRERLRVTAGAGATASCPSVMGWLTTWRVSTGRRRRAALLTDSCRAGPIVG